MSAVRPDRAHALAVLGLVLLASACAGRGRAESLVSSTYVPFTMTATSADTAFTGTFTGRMRRAGDDVEVVLDDGRLTYTGSGRSGRTAGPREVNAIAFALAQGDRSGFWRVASRSGPAHVRRVLDAGGHLTLDAHTFRIDRRGLPLEEYWLVVEIENVLIDVPAAVEARGVAYLHGERDIFSGIP